MNGFEALAEFDDNHDGRITECDAVWSRLVLWRDANRDGISQPEELQSLTAAGVVAIDLGYETLERCDPRGNCERERATFWWRDASGTLRPGAVVDVHLPARSSAASCSGQASISR
jgi:hypothetical protein